MTNGIENMECLKKSTVLLNTLSRILITDLQVNPYELFLLSSLYFSKANAFSSTYMSCQKKSVIISGFSNKRSVPNNYQDHHLLELINNTPQIDSCFFSITGKTNGVSLGDVINFIMTYASRWLHHDTIPAHGPFVKLKPKVLFQASVKVLKISPIINKRIGDWKTRTFFFFVYSPVALHAHWWLLILGFFFNVFFYF